MRLRAGLPHRLTGRVDELETAEGGEPAAWIAWDTDPGTRATLGAFHLLRELEVIHVPA